MSYYMEQLGGATDMHGGKTRWFQDENEPEKLISEAQLKKEYGSNVADGSIDPAEKTFQDYLWCCMSSQGGTLTEVFPEKETKAKYPFMIRETLTMHVEVEADSFEEAKSEVERLYCKGEFNLDHNCFAGAEFLPCCSCCESDFGDDDDLREVDEGTPQARMLCDRCVSDMENSGELTRCECCEDLFTPSRLKINPQNGLQEICPLCGKVWCE